MPRSFRTSSAASTTRKKNPLSRLPSKKLTKENTVLLHPLEIAAHEQKINVGTQLGINPLVVYKDPALRRLAHYYWKPAELAQYIRPKVFANILRHTMIARDQSVDKVRRIQANLAKMTDTELITLLEATNAIPKLRLRRERTSAISKVEKQILEYTPAQGELF